MYVQSVFIKARYENPQTLFVSGSVLEQYLLTVKRLMLMVATSWQEMAACRIVERRQTNKQRDRKVDR